MHKKHVHEHTIVVEWKFTNRDTHYAGDGAKGQIKWHNLVAIKLRCVCGDEIART